MLFKKEIKLNLSLDNAFLLGELINELDFIKDMFSMTQNDNKSVEQIGMEFLRKALADTVQNKDKIYNVMDKIVGIKNSAKKVQIPQIIKAFKDDTSIGEVKAFFKSAFK